MPSLILLLLLACGQERYEETYRPYLLPRNCRSVADTPTIICEVGKLDFIRIPDHSRVREWLRPKPVYFQEIHVWDYSPSITLLLTDGRRVTITRAEIDARAKEE